MLQGAAAADAIARDEPQLAAVLQKHVARRLLRVDAHAICRQPGSRQASTEWGSFTCNRLGCPGAAGLTKGEAPATLAILYADAQLQLCTIGDDGAGGRGHLELQQGWAAARRG